MPSSELLYIIAGCDWTAEHQKSFKSKHKRDKNTTHQTPSLFSPHTKKNNVKNTPNPKTQITPKLKHLKPEKAKSKKKG